MIHDNFCYIFRDLQTSSVDDACVISCPYSCDCVSTATDQLSLWQQRKHP
jgi:hypothetical protein